MEQTIGDGDNSTENPSSLKNCDVSSLLNSLSKPQSSEKEELISDLLNQFDETEFLSDESIRNFVEYIHDKKINLKIDKIY